MKSLFYSSLFLVLLSACIQQKPDEKTQRSAPERSELSLSRRHQEMSDACGFDNTLGDPKTPLIAKKLFTDSYDFDDDEPLQLFNNLENGPQAERLFYFKVITKISDGYYSEALGQKTAEYVSDHTKDFAELFANTGCIGEADLQTWADNVTLHLKTTAPQTQDAAADYLNVLHDHYKYCSKEERLVIGHFAFLVNENWQEYLAEK